jgi:hypothetical protein
MSFSAAATKVGLSLGALCAAAVLAGFGAVNSVNSADGDDTPPPPETTAPATTEGHPWHG